MFLELILISVLILNLFLKLKRRLFRTNVKGENVLITGGASGIGKLCALELARQGAHVTIWDIDQQALGATEDEFSHQNLSILTYRVDLARREEIDRACLWTLEKSGRVDILINSAGIVGGKSLLDTDNDSIQRTLDVNVASHFWTVKAFLPGMQERQHGHIVTISSMAGYVGVPRLVDYVCSKFAVVGFNEGLRVEFEKNGYTGLYTTCICPFYINTGMFEGVKTRFPSLIPILEPGQVARRIVKAIEMKEEVVMMPWIMSFTPLIRALPVPIMDWVFDRLGINHTMDDFVDHKKRKAD